MIEIVIPAYNCSKTLKRTLFSLVSQMDTNFKVLLIDDCSTENIKTIVDEFNNLLDIKYIRNKENLGIGMTRQVGIDNAKEDYITFLDADDMFMPYTIHIFNQMIKKYPECNLFHSYFYEQTDINHTEVLLLRQDGYMWCHGKIYKKEFLKKYNIKNLPEVKYYEDNFFNSMCLELEEFKTIKTPMMIWMNTTNSWCRKPEPHLREIKFINLVDSIYKSTKFLLNFKSIDEISHLPATLSAIKNEYQKFLSLLSPNDEKYKEIVKVIATFQNLLENYNYNFSFTKKNK